MKRVILVLSNGKIKIVRNTFGGHHGSPVGTLQEVRQEAA